MKSFDISFLYLVLLCISTFLSYIVSPYFLGVSFIILCLKHSHKLIYIILSSVFCYSYIASVEQQKSSERFQAKTIALNFIVEDVSSGGTSGFFYNDSLDLRVFSFTNHILKLGETYRLFGSVSLPKNDTNPGGFKFKSYLFQNDTYLVLRCDSIKQLNIEMPLRYKLFRFFEGSIRSGQVKALFFAFILGKKQYLDSEFKAQFYQVGLGHFLALSGLHMGLLLYVFWTVLSHLTRSFKLRFGSVVIIIILFIALVGLKPPIFRAGIMALLFLYGRYTEKYINFYHILWVTGCLNCVFFPFDLFKISFWLSYSALFSLVYGAHRLNRILDNYQMNEHSPKRVAVIKYIGISIFPYIGTFPIVFILFGKVSSSSVLMNVFLTPFLIFIFYLCVSYTFLLVFSVSVARVYEHLLDGSISLLTFIIDSVSKIPMLENRGNAVLSLLCIAVLVYGLHIRKRIIKRMFGGIIYVLCIMQLSVWIIQKYWFHMIVFDLGQAQSILFKQDKMYFLYDAGRDLKQRLSKTNQLQKYIQRITDDSLAFVIISHKDYDHIGNLNELFVQAKYTHSKDSVFLPFPKFMKVNNCVLHSLNIVHPNASENDKSVVLQLVYGKIKYLLTGDISSETEQMIAEQYDLKSHVLLVSHHGSHSSSTPSFLKDISPEISVVSVGTKNRYGHPNPEVLERLTAYGQVYRTDVDGFMHFITDGKRMFKIPRFVSEIIL